ncbi:MAG TPA: carboxypeptidase regulatory-like domain-containing protein, partial [Xanthomonadales bacterium]|nr:carboxypeptidase regulatory-like domain-containing protein [Xanthomonadales bacterium]
GGASIYGKVRITRKLTSQKMRFRLYPGLKSMPPAETSREVDERRNIVIYLEPAESIPAAGIPGAPIPEQNPSIKQEGETFIPHVLPIVKGTTVDFPNLDPIFHNVFSLSGARSFDLGRYPQGSSRSVTFDQSGVVPVFCHLHSDMSAIILVLDNPFFSVPDTDGNYRIGNVPPGTYTLIGWHERSERTEQKVTLKPGETVELDVLIPIDDEQ